MYNAKNSTIRDWLQKLPKNYRLALRLLVALLIAVISNILISSWFDTPKMASIRRQNQRLKAEYSILQGKIRSAEHLLADIKHRDQFVYRPLLGIDTLNIPQVYSEYNDSKYASFQGGEYSEIITEGWKSLDQLTRSIYYASLSLDDTQDLAENKEEFSTVIPAIWPIDRTKLKNVSSLYGMRVHPRYGYWKMHEGIDLSAPKGTPVYATGNAVVTRSSWQPGYGQLIELNHGFGYKTRYGHLSKRYVSPGDSVTRGQVIGEVGNTGVSSGSHLHYEVRFRDKTVNPIHYFNKDMSPESYMDLMNQLDNSTQNN
ncbi:MAG: M23 family metallopeptidase [Alistipes sp.]|nr:M23 family metallopeptidase [Alistipes sp.]MBR5197322.1 M23 family metallopeptidase [Alistipes sp.]MBR5585159.1 M23 family metallopeptidase [Alistipes sp.]MBR6543911.1 M23 family metallopeptidase [Alistipes sp.]